VLVHSSQLAWFDWMKLIFAEAAREMIIRHISPGKQSITSHSGKLPCSLASGLARCFFLHQ